MRPHYADPEYSVNYRFMLPLIGPVGMPGTAASCQ